MHNKGVSDEITWLDSVALPLSSQSIDPWSKHHSNLKRQVPDLPGIHAVLPLMNAAVHTLQTQHHCMQYIKRVLISLTLVKPKLMCAINQSMH